MELSINKLIAAITTCTFVTLSYNNAAYSQFPQFPEEVDGNNVGYSPAGCYFKFDQARGKYIAMDSWYYKYELYQHNWEDPNTGEAITGVGARPTGVLQYHNTKDDYNQKFDGFEQVGYESYTDAQKERHENNITFTFSFGKKVEEVYALARQGQHYYFASPQGVCPERPKEECTTEDLTNPDDMVCEENHHGGEYILEDGRRREY